MRTADEMRAWSRAAVEAWNAKDLDGFFSTFHDDVVYHGGQPLSCEEWPRYVTDTRWLCKSVLT